MERKKRGQHSEESSIIREAVTFSASTYTFQFISVIRGLIIAHVLSPSFYGVWSILKTFFQFGSFIGLGSSQAMAREVPFYDGQGDAEKGRRIKQNTLTWCLLLAVTISLTTSFLSFTPFVENYKLEMRLASLVFIFNAVHLYIPHLLRSERRIYLLSRYYMTYAILNTVFGLSLVFTFKVAGLLIGMALSMMILIIVLIQNKYLNFNLQLQKKTLKYLFRIGFPILLIASTVHLMTSIDKVVIFFMLGSIETGYYGLASFFSEIINYLPQAITTVLLPRMIYQLGQKKGPKELEHFYTKPLFLLAGIVPILLGFIVINIDLFILYLVPKYTPSVEVLRILILGLFFAVVWTIPKYILIAFNKQNALMLWIPVFLLFGTIVDILVIQMGFGILGVATGSAFVLFCVSLFTNIYALQILEKKTREKLQTAGKIYGPFFYILCGLLPTFSITMEHPLFTDAVRSLVFLIYCLPLLIYVNKHSQILQKVFVAFGKP
jgi:O-antigen/teichoic acid export membrane protein